MKKSPVIKNAKGYKYKHPNKKIMGKIIENYTLQEQLGQGVYAKVYRAIHNKTKQEVAIKVIQVDKFRDIPKLEEGIVNEINILSQINRDCEFIVKYIDMLKTTNNFYFIYQFCNGGTLEKLLQKDGPLQERRALLYARQLLEAFKTLSRNNIMHRDLKPDNILLHNGNIKLADFGFCKPLESKNDLAQTMLGSPIYMAPEVLKGQIYTMKADVWSFGVVVYQMIFGRCPFQSKSIAMLIKQLDKTDMVIPEYPKISPNTEEFLRKILVKDANRRLSWEELFNQYVVLETGEIIKKREQRQMELRSSLRGGKSPTFNIPLKNNHNGRFSEVNMGNNMSQDIGSPKINRSFEMKSFDEKTLVMRKRSPYQKGTTVSSEYQTPPQNIQLTKPPVQTPPHPSEFSPTSSTNASNALCSTTDGMSFHQKSDRSGRLEILLKNHLKPIQINQMILDTNTLDQKYAVYVSCLLLKTIQKQMMHLYENLRKELTNKSENYENFKEFKLMVEKQYQAVKNMGDILIQQLTEQEEQNQLLSNPEELEQQKHRILKLYIENLRDNDDDLRLASQIIDYLQQSILIKKDAYERMSREHLHRQIKNKLAKF